MHLGVGNLCIGRWRVPDNHRRQLATSQYQCEIYGERGLRKLYDIDEIGPEAAHARNQ